MSRLKLAIDQIITARKYSLRLIDNTKPDDWFRQPVEGISHIGWQVAHLAVAEYWLTLNRIRGQKPEDDQLIPETIRKQFGRESVPDANPANNPTPSHIRTVLDRVHQQTLDELWDFPESEWDKPVSRPHLMFAAKMDAVFWCSGHELIHAGQIGLLRRLHGQPPLW